MAMGDYDRALEAFASCLSKLTVVYGARHASSGRILAQQAVTLLLRDRAQISEITATRKVDNAGDQKKLAMQLLQQAKDIYEESGWDASMEMLEVNENLAPLLVEMGR